MLHKASKVIGFHIHAADGTIGHLDDLLFEAVATPGNGGWSIRYLVVDTSNWIGGRSVLIAPSLVTAVDAADRTITVSLSRDQIQRSPSVDTADIETMETLPTVWIM